MSNMKKILLVLFTLGFMQLNAGGVNVNYGVSFGVLGELGTASVSLNESGKNYIIDIHAKTTGVVRVMSGNRQERHTSRGHIAGGKYISDSYSVHISHGNKIKDKLYTIDHKAKRVTKRIIKKEGGKIVSDEVEKLDFYSPNDLLSIYMNTPKLISPSGDTSKSYRLKAVGAENQDGSIEILVPSISQLPRYKKELGDGHKWYFKAIINQPIFASKRGEFMISMDENGVTQKAVLQDLLMFGDLVARKK
jgi:hypothetical protein